MTAAAVPGTWLNSASPTEYLGSSVGESDERVASWVRAYGRLRVVSAAYYEIETRDGAKSLARKEARERLRALEPSQPKASLVEILAVDPLLGVDIIVGMSPYLQLALDGSFDGTTVEFLLRSPAWMTLEKEIVARPPNPQAEPQRWDFYLFFGPDPRDERLASFQQLSREEIYRRVIARLPEVGQEKMFGVLVAMFQIDPWLAAITIDELAETGELPVKRPADAKPTAAQRLRETIESSRDILVKSRVWSRDGIIGSGTLGPLLPMALEFAGERWWIRAALAREMEMEKLKAEEAEAYSSLPNRPYSPLMSARDALMNDPHPVVRYVVFNRLERNRYEDSLAEFRKVVKGARLSDPESPQAQRAQSLAERREERQRLLESRLGKPITEIPEPPKE
ncbi:MAG: hypothetical protein SFY95_12675 [Planctomycetota bacterium]|nr:hypothetical protein [Planctomycetota bacterium]